MHASRQYFISIWLIVAILINFMGVITTANLLHNKNLQLANDDIVLICNGRSFQYILLSTFESTGQIVHIEPPASEGTHTELDCPTSESLDSKYSLAISVLQTLFYSNKPSSNVFPLNSIRYTDGAYFLSLARAPPFLV